MLTTGYRPRTISFLQLWENDGWRIKVYGIGSSAPAPRAELVEATVAALPESLPGGDEPGVHGLGFAIAHDAGDYCFALVDWFANENEIHQRVLSADLDTPSALTDHGTRAIGCVWELAVTDHERRAWMEHVLVRPGTPDLDATLEAEL